MTILSSSARVAYVADGTGRTFPVPFRVWTTAEVAVFLRLSGSLQDQPQQPGIDFAWDGSALPGPGAIMFTLPPPQGSRIVIERRAELVQELDLIPAGAFAAETIEAQFDRVTAQLQSLAHRLDRTPQLPPGTPIDSPAMPEPALARAGQLLAISADGRTYECKVPAALGLQPVSAFAASLLDDPDASTARATLGIGTQVDLNLLPTDPTGGAAADLIPFVDASEAGASNKVPVPAFMANAVAALGTTGASPDHELLARSPSSATLARLAASLVGAGRQTIWVPAAALQPRLVAGASPVTAELPGNRLVLRTLDFDPLVQEHAQLLVHMPRSWNRGSLTAIILWTHAAASGPFNVVWGLRAMAAGDAGSLDAAFGAPVLVTDTGGTAQALYRSAETTGFAPASLPADASLLALELFRAASDPADTLPVDARLVGLALHYVTTANTDA